MRTMVAGLFIGAVVAIANQSGVPSKGEQRLKPPTAEQKTDTLPARTTAEPSRKSNPQ